MSWILENGFSSLGELSSGFKEKWTCPLTAGRSIIGCLNNGTSTAEMLEVHMTQNMGDKIIWIVDKCYSKVPSKINEKDSQGH